MSGLLMFTSSEETAKPVGDLCAQSGWSCRRGLTAADLAPAAENEPPDAVLIDLAHPLDNVDALVQEVSEQYPFMPVIFVTDDHAPAEDFGDGLRYYVGPGRFIDLEHILISLSCGFPSGPPIVPARADATRVPRVLIVDDNLELANLIERRLRSLERFDVRVTGSGFQAATLLPMFHPDVVVIDLVLDDMDGREVCAFIRNNENLRKTRIIGVSGYLPEGCAAGKKDMFDAFLEKPFRVKDLVDRIVSLAQPQAPPQPPPG